MRGRSSRAAGGSKVGMEVDKLDYKVKEEPHLSGAYIRSLVKQLTSTRNKDPMDSNDPPPDMSSGSSSGDGDGDGDGFPGHQNFSKFGQAIREEEEGGGLQPQPQPAVPQQQQHKKQVRRRLHTSRPYQERLLNMAEARREIVTALKFHRAAMKQAANEQHQHSPPPPPPPQQPQPQTHQSPPSVLVKLPGKTKSRRNPRIYPSSSNSNFSKYYMENISSSPSPSPYSSFSPSLQNPYSWPANYSHQIAPPVENLNLPLPNQPLGLNLNIHDFNNLDATLYFNNSSDNNPPSVCSWSSSSPPTVYVATDQEAGLNNNSAAISQQGTPLGATNVGNEGGGGGLEGLHPAMDDEEMAEIRSVGEQHQMEWNDTMNLVTSAWWFKFFKTTADQEIGGGGKKDNGDDEDDDDDNVDPFDQFLEFPAWLNPNDENGFHCLDDHCLDDYYSQDPALPCMDIGEIEGIDGEWLS